MVTTDLCLDRIRNWRGVHSSWIDAIAYTEVPQGMAPPNTLFVHFRTRPSGAVISHLVSRETHQRFMAEVAAGKSVGKSYHEIIKPGKIGEN